MKSLFVLAFAMIVSPVLAADRITLSLSPNEAATITQQGLHKLDGAPHIVHDARGDEQAVTVPYRLGEAVLTIAHDIQVLTAVVQGYQSVATNLVDAAGTDEAARAKAQKEAALLADKKSPVEVLSLSATDLRATENALPPSVLAALGPICPSCVLIDPPKLAQ